MKTIESQATKEYKSKLATRQQTIAKHASQYVPFNDPVAWLHANIIEILEKEDPGLSPGPQVLFRVVFRILVLVLVRVMGPLFPVCLS